MIRSLTIALLGVGAGLIAGYTIGQQGGGGGKGESAGEATAGRIGRAISSEPIEAEETEEVAGVPSEDADDDEVKRYVEKLAGDDPSAAIAWVREHLENGDRGDLYRVIAARWAMAEPEEAFLWASGLKRVDERSGAYAGSIEGALKAGKEAAALRMIERIPSGRIRDEVLQQAAGLLAETNVARALELVGEAGSSSAYRQGVELIFTKMIAAGRMEEAKAIVMQARTPYEDRERYMIYGLVKAMAAGDSRQALLWVTENNELLDGYMGSSISRYIGQEFAHENPHEALTWGEMIPEGRARDAFLERVGDKWIGTESEVAGDWLVKGINEKGYEAVGSMAEGMLEEWVEINQEQPFEYIERIQDGEARDQAMNLAMKELARENPAMAAERLVDWETADVEQAKKISDRLMDYWMDQDARAASERRSG